MGRLRCFGQQRIEVSALNASFAPVRRRLGKIRPSDVGEEHSRRLDLKRNTLSEPNDHVRAGQALSRGPQGFLPEYKSASTGESIDDLREGGNSLSETSVLRRACIRQIQDILHGGNANAAALRSSGGTAELEQQAPGPARAAPAPRPGPGPAVAANSENLAAHFSQRPMRQLGNKRQAQPLQLGNQDVPGQRQLASGSATKQLPQQLPQQLRPPTRSSAAAAASTPVGHAATFSELPSFSREDEGDGQTGLREIVTAAGVSLGLHGRSFQLDDMAIWSQLHSAGHAPPPQAQLQDPRADVLPVGLAGATGQATTLPELPLLSPDPDIPQTQPQPRRQRQPPAQWLAQLESAAQDASRSWGQSQRPSTQGVASAHSAAPAVSAAAGPGQVPARQALWDFQLEGGKAWPPTQARTQAQSGPVPKQQTQPRPRPQLQPPTQQPQRVSPLQAAGGYPQQPQRLLAGEAEPRRKGPGAGAAAWLPGHAVTSPELPLFTFEAPAPVTRGQKTGPKACVGELQSSVSPFPCEEGKCKANLVLEQQGGLRVMEPQGKADHPAHAFTESNLPLFTEYSSEEAPPRRPFSDHLAHCPGAGTLSRMLTSQKAPALARTGTRAQALHSLTPAWLPTHLGGGQKIELGMVPERSKTEPELPAFVWEEEEEEEDDNDTPRGASWRAAGDGGAAARRQLKFPAQGPPGLMHPDAQLDISRAQVMSLPELPDLFPMAELLEEAGAAKLHELREPQPQCPVGAVRTEGDLPVFVPQSVLQMRAGSGSQKLSRIPGRSAAGPPGLGASRPEKPRRSAPALQPPLPPGLVTSSGPGASGQSPAAD